MRKAAGMVLLVVVLAGCSGAYDPNNEREAVSQCEGFADKRLKAPAGADYDLAASETEDGWMVTGTVDAENGFGAKIRSNVQCLLHFEGDTAHLDDIAIG